VKPQSKQTKSFGDAETVGFVRFSGPGKWMLSSLLNVVCFLDPHNLQDTPRLLASDVRDKTLLTRRVK